MTVKFRIPRYWEKSICHTYGRGKSMDAGVV